MVAWRYEISLRVYSSTLEEKFRISAWSCNIFYDSISVIGYGNPDSFDLEEGIIYRENAKVKNDFSTLDSHFYRVQRFENYFHLLFFLV